MTLSQGRGYLAIPGPSVIPDAVLQAMHQTAPNIYEGPLIDLTKSIVEDLKWVACSTQHVAIYIANGHGAWEAALANIAEPGDKVLVAATGRFGHGWAEMARRMGIGVELLDFGMQSMAEPAQIAQALKDDRDRQIKAVLICHVDTSTSVRNDILQVRQAMDAVDHPALLAVDCIASLACDRFEFDAWGVDVMVAGCQKGLMVPPGLSFVFFSEQAAKRQKALRHVSSYWDWAPRVAPQLFYEYFCGTAPTHHLFGLRIALDMLKDEGLPHIWARHETLAQAIWSAVDIWGQAGGTMALNITDPAQRSHAVTAMHMGVPATQNLRQWLEQNTGVTVGIGLGMSTPTDPDGKGFFRFGHMGHVNAQMIMALLGSVEAGLCALSLPHGAGALEAAARVIGSTR